MPGAEIPEYEWPRVRLCSIRKSEPGEEYGFNLHAEKGKGQFIGAVDDDSPAERGGLCSGDRIIAINGDVVVHDQHREVLICCHYTF